MSIYIPYFYVIQDTYNGMYYAGAKWGKNSRPDHFMVEGGYTTSSRLINDLISEYGLSRFKVRKIRVFKAGNDAYEYETTFLQKVNAGNNPMFYNGHNNTIPAIGTEEYKKMMLDRYGVDHNMKVPSVQKSRKEKITQKWGSISKMIKDTGAIEKMKRTNEKRYGCQYTILTDEVIKKREDKCLEKYGVKSPFQSKDVQREMKKKSLVSFAKNYDKKQEPLIKEVLDSGIDFSRLGWVSRVAEIIQISPQKVKGWMIRNMPDFYETQCYKRKSPTKK